MTVGTSLKPSAFSLQPSEAFYMRIVSLIPQSSVTKPELKPGKIGTILTVNIVLE